MDKRQDSFSGEPRTLPVVPSEVVIDSPAPVYVRGMHPEDFRHFYEKVKSRPFKDDQIAMMRTVARNNRLNCVQSVSYTHLDVYKRQASGLHYLCKKICRIWPNINLMKIALKR